MLSEHTIERVLTAALSKGGDFAEIFMEEAKSSGLSLINGRVDKVSSGIDFGVGIRILEKTKCVYVFSNDIREDNLIRMAADASASLLSVPEGLTVHLSARQDYISNPYIIAPVGVD